MRRVHGWVRSCYGEVRRKRNRKGIRLQNLNFIPKSKNSSIIYRWLSSENWKSASVKEVTSSIATTVTDTQIQTVLLVCMVSITWSTYGCMYMQIECTINAYCFNFTITQLCTCCTPSPMYCTTSMLCTRQIAFSALFTEPGSELQIRGWIGRLAYTAYGASDAAEWDPCVRHAKSCS